VKVAIPKLPELYCTECGLILHPEGWRIDSHKDRDDLVFTHYREWGCKNAKKEITVKYDDFWEIRDFPEVESTIPVAHGGSESTIKG